MGTQIVTLAPQAFEKCGAIWNTARQKQLADEFRRDLLSGNRITYLYELDGVPIGEISLVFDKGDAAYTIPGQRAYVSHLIVQPAHRRQGVGRALVRFVEEQARAMGYRALSIGVDLDNTASLRLYIGCGFRQILCMESDDRGAYLKLLKPLDGERSATWKPAHGVI